MGIKFDNGSVKKPELSIRGSAGQEGDRRRRKGLVHCAFMTECLSLSRFSESRGKHQQEQV